MTEDFTPRKYQVTIAKKMVTNPRFGVFADPGLGKTAAVLLAFDYLQRRALVSSMLVVAPLRVVYSTWPAEIAHWTQFSRLRCQILHTPRKSPRNRAALLERLNDPEADVFLINPEGLPWLVKQDWECPPEMLVVDESTDFKNDTNVRSRNLKLLYNHFLYRYILTGTPAPNGLLDLFGQMFILDEGESLGQNMASYKSQYFFPEPSHTGFTQWKPQRDALPRIRDRIKSKVIHLSAEDHLDLPELIHVQRMVTLPAKARKIYNELKTELMVEFENDQAIVASNPGVLSSKLRQVTDGAAYYTHDGVLTDEPTRKDQAYEIIHKEKVLELMRLVNELSGQPLLVSYEFKHHLEMIRDVFAKPGVHGSGMELPYIGSGVSAKEGERLQKLWNRGKLPVLLLHPKSAARGLNLQFGGCRLAWFTQTWNLEWYLQMIRRVWRQGQKNTTLIYHIAAQDTIDERIMRVRTGKDKLEQGLLGMLKEEVTQ